MRRPPDFNWLILLLASWAIPVWWPHSYLFSLIFWVLPIAALLPDFLSETGTGTGRRRRALWYATAWIVGLGVVLDFGLGQHILTFNGPWYWWRIRGIPVEEVLFYTFAPMATVLVYAWCDEHWLKAYSRSRYLDDMLAGGPPLIELSPRIAVAAVTLFAAAIAVKSVTAGRLAIPVYATFLIAAAFVPAAVCYRAVGHHVNWRAFGATTLYVIGTSLAYEVTLAIPLRWWGYQPDATLGVFVERWSTPHERFPVEAAMVWVAAPFSCVLTYELVKAYLHHPGRGARARLVGAPTAKLPPAP